MDDQDDNEVHPALNFFSRRAKLVAKVSNEEIRAATELFNKELEEKSKSVLDGDYVVLPVIKSIQNSTSEIYQPKRKKVKKSLFLGDEENEVVRHKITLSYAAKRRIEKREREREEELKDIEEENERVLSSLSSLKSADELMYVEKVPVDTFKKVTVLSISYLSEVARLKCYDSDKFSTIFPKVAEKFNLKASEMLLSYNQQIIDVNDSPQSLGYIVTDVIDCVPYKIDEKAEAVNQYDTNNLKIFFQSNDTKTKIQMLVHKLEDMQSIMEKYSQQRDIPLNGLEFEFDGETITGAETPDDLDMESGNTIDVKVSVEYIKPTAPKKVIPKKDIESGNTVDGKVSIEDPKQAAPKQAAPKKATPKKRNARKRGRPKKRGAKKRTPPKRGKKVQKDIVTIDSDTNDSEVLLSD